MGRSRTMLAAAAALLLGPGHATAGFLNFNTDFVNTTGSVLNDFHVKLVSTAPITISSTWQTGGNVAFNPGAVSGNGTNTVQVDWSGATVNQNQSTHVGVSTAAYDPNIKIVESWWTVGGVKFVPATAAMATPDFTGAGNFTVARISLFDSTGTTRLGTQWVQGLGGLTGLTNFTSDGPIYVRVATLSSPTAIPLENLNFNLNGFGADSALTTLVPEPSSLLLCASGLAGLALVSRRLAPRAAA